MVTFADQRDAHAYHNRDAVTEFQQGAFARNKRADTLRAAVSAFSATDLTHNLPDAIAQAVVASWGREIAALVLSQAAKEVAK